ncbi:MAG: 2-dehydropantoate 2-reductase [Rhodospirillaceae bacterium]|nr:2-dehydropantoate 2-reductase [Rhodospirillaceae bacterium]
MAKPNESKPRVCIVGPGAIGGMMAVHLQRAGYDVSALARPAKAAEIKAKGITLLDGGQTYRGQPKVSADPAELGAHDIVVVTVKSDGLATVVPHLPALSKPDAPWVFVMNGVPWWFFSHFGGAKRGTALNSVDPSGNLARMIPLERVVWGVINCGVSIRPDGVLSHDHSNQLQLGRPDLSRGGLASLAEVFTAAGYNTETTDRIHHAIWTKLLANMTFNPLSALTSATSDLILTDPMVREFTIAVADEGRAVGEALGIPGGPPARERFAAAGRLGKSKTSMLADMERGRPLEIEPIIGAAVEIADLLGVPVPNTKALYGLVRVRAKAAGLA